MKFSLLHLDIWLSRKIDLTEVYAEDYFWSRPVKSHTICVSLMHSRSNSCSETGMLKSHANL